MYKKCTFYAAEGLGAFLWRVLVRMSTVSQCTQQWYVLWYKKMSQLVLFVLVLPYQRTRPKLNQICSGLVV